MTERGPDSGESGCAGREGPVRRLLIVDESSESREVLRTVLQPRGIEVLEATEARQGLELLQMYRPEVIVLDLDSAAADDEDVQSRYAQAGPQQQLVLLGRARLADPQAAIFAKPYHYGPLVRTIERLFERASAESLS